MIPAPLEVLIQIRVELSMGRSISNSIETILLCRQDGYSRALLAWFKRVQAGQATYKILSLLPELSRTLARKNLITVLERGLLGSPCDEALEQLEKDFFLITEAEYERHLQLLPIKLLFPLVFFVLPAVLTLLLAPLISVWS